MINYHTSENASVQNAKGSAGRRVFPIGDCEGVLVSRPQHLQDVFFSLAVFLVSLSRGTNMRVFLSASIFSNLPPWVLNCICFGLYPGLFLHSISGSFIMDDTERMQPMFERTYTGIASLSLLLPELYFIRRSKRHPTAWAEVKAETTKDPYIVEFDGPDDPLKPENWSSRKKSVSLDTDVSYQSCP